MVYRVQAKATKDAGRAMTEEVNAAVSRALADWGDAVLERADEEAPTGVTPGPDSLRQSGTRIPAKPATSVQVVFSAPWALFVHEGTRPHWPPKGVLVRWIELVLGKSEKEAIRLDFLIRRKIARFGTKPNPFLQRAVDAVQPFVEGLFRRAFEEGAARLEARFR